MADSDTTAQIQRQELHQSGHSIAAAYFVVTLGHFKYN